MSFPRPFPSHAAAVMQSHALADVGQRGEVLERVVEAARARGVVLARRAAPARASQALRAHGAWAEPWHDGAGASSQAWRRARLGGARGAGWERGTAAPARAS